MVAEGSQAPSVTAPLANGDIDEFDLEKAVPDESPIVLAFFPGAFTSVCTHEMNTFEDRLDAYEETGATVYGVSIDTPFSQNEFRDQLGLSFGLISDIDREIIDAFDVGMDFDSLGVHDVAKRAVFVIDDDGTVAYKWVSDDPAVEPDYDEVEEAVEAAA